MMHGLTGSRSQFSTKRQARLGLVSLFIINFVFLCALWNLLRYRTEPHKRNEVDVVLRGKITQCSKNVQHSLDKSGTKQEVNHFSLCQLFSKTAEGRQLKINTRRRLNAVYWIIMNTTIIIAIISLLQDCYYRYRHYHFFMRDWKRIRLNTNKVVWMIYIWFVFFLEKCKIPFGDFENGNEPSFAKSIIPKVWNR